MRDIAAPFTYCEMCYYITVWIYFSARRCTRPKRGLFCYTLVVIYFCWAKTMASAWKSERAAHCYGVFNYQLYSCAESAISAPALGEHKLLWKRLRVIFILRLIYFLWRMQVGSIFHSGEQLNWGEILFQRENRKHHFPCSNFLLGWFIRCFFGTGMKVRMLIMELSLLLNIFKKLFKTFIKILKNDVLRHFDLNR